MDMERYILGLGDRNSVEELRAYFIEQAASFGATYVAGYPLTFGQAGEAGANLVYVSNFTSEISEVYQKYAAGNDPFMEATLVKGGPVQYTRVRDVLSWDARQHLYFSKLPEFSMLDGVGSPVSCKPGIVAYFIMIFPEERPAMSWAELRRIYVYFSEFFARYWELTRHERPQISARERQILVGIMNGKSKTEISDQLGLSVHTVDTYTRRCFEKLEAKTRTEAAIKAFGLGLAYTDFSLSDV